MTGTKLANRYAKSLLQLAIERNEVQQVFEDMIKVEETCKNSRDLTLLLQSPIIKTDKKKAILHEIFEKQTEKTSMAFIDVITSKKREYYLQQIAEEYLIQYKEHKNIVTATVTTTMKLDERLREKILVFINNQTKKEVDLIEQVDEKLIGGFVLRIGDKQVDASIQRKLNDLKKEFNKNPYVKDF